ncbi:hypothetical protein MSG28_004872 [Choristoneura fumiferana]|uniref:Uncharacterized protein n=1 Tax=Choristoneura fumiferana TaxID=7141 RepID=A0ACC0K7L7_CHOFU|nr:hypothetical protein MSG28_004872 [Choristoneura fumiferana]
MVSVDLVEGGLILTLLLLFWPRWPPAAAPAGAGAGAAGGAPAGAAAACVVAVDADEIRRLGKRFRKLDLDNSGALSIDEFMSLPELQQNPLVQRVIDIFDADGNGEVSTNLYLLQTQTQTQQTPRGTCRDGAFLFEIYFLLFYSIARARALLGAVGLQVDFKEFIQGVSQFSVKGDKLSKLRFAFRIYDMDNDGFISNGELFQVPAVQGLSRSMLIASADDGQCIGQVLKMMVGNNLKDTQLQQIVDKTILFADRDEDGKISFDEFCSVVGNTDIHKKMVVDV